MNKNKIITIITALIMIAGIIVVLTTGFNVDMLTQEHKETIVELKKEYDSAELKSLVKEALGNQDVEIQKVNDYGEIVLISAKEMTEEQKNDLVSKLNEKYQSELKADEVKINTMPRARLLDDLTPYIWTFAIVTVSIMIYVAIRYKKIGSLKAVILMGLGLVMLEGVALSICAIARIPVGQNLLAITYAMYALGIFIISAMLENKLQKLKSEEKKNKKKKE